eukprot:g11285.t1
MYIVHVTVIMPGCSFYFAAYSWPLVMQPLVTKYKLDSGIAVTDPRLPAAQCFYETWHVNFMLKKPQCPPDYRAHDPGPRLSVRPENLNPGPGLN